MTMNSIKNKPCPDCDILPGGKGRCTMNCGPSAPPVVDLKTSILKNSGKPTTTCTKTAKKCSEASRNKPDGQGKRSMRTRNAEYLQISQALEDLCKVNEALSPAMFRPYRPEECKAGLQKAIEYLEERKITVSPTSGKNRPSPR